MHDNKCTKRGTYNKMWREHLVYVSKFVRKLIYLKRACVIMHKENIKFSGGIYCSTLPVSTINCISLMDEEKKSKKVENPFVRMNCSYRYCNRGSNIC